LGGLFVEVLSDEGPDRHVAVTLAVRDNGIGIEPQVLETGRIGHWGFAGMRERAERMGAKISILSRLVSGTEIILAITLSLVDPRGGKESFWRRGYVFAKKS
jgi:nitrate/nitrite-specific signal transduction histidine kinase